MIINFIESDLYKVRKTKSTLVILIFFVLFNAGCALMPFFVDIIRGLLVVNENEVARAKGIIDFQGLFLAFESSNNLLWIYFSIIAVKLITEEKNTGFIRNKINVNANRSDNVTSKFIVSIMFAAFLFIIQISIYVLADIFIYDGIMHDYDLQYFNYVGMLLLLAIAAVSFTVFISYVFKNNIITYVIVSLISFNVPYTITFVLEKTVFRDGLFIKYLDLTYYVQCATGYVFVNSEDKVLVDDKTLIMATFVSLLYIIVSYFGSIIIYNKEDA